MLDAARAAISGTDDPAGSRLLVIGGSQGARIMSDIVPAAIAALPRTLRGAARYRAAGARRGLKCAFAKHGRLGVEAEIAPFFADLPRRMARAHLVIARAGASTVSELAVIGRPGAFSCPIRMRSIRIRAPMRRIWPRPARPTSSRSPDSRRLISHGKLGELLACPETLTRRAAAAKQAGIPDAADRLADLVRQR